MACMCVGYVWRTRSCTNKISPPRQGSLQNQPRKRHPDRQKPRSSTGVSPNKPRKRHPEEQEPRSSTGVAPRRGGGHAGLTPPGRSNLTRYPASCNIGDAPFIAGLFLFATNRLCENYQFELIAGLSKSYWMWISSLICSNGPDLG